MNKTRSTSLTKCLCNNNNHKTDVLPILVSCTVVHSGERNYIIMFSLKLWHNKAVRIICFFDDELRGPGLKEAVKLASIILTLFLLVLFSRTLHQSL